MNHRKIANNCMRFVRQGVHKMSGEEAETVYAETVAWLIEIGHGGLVVLPQKEYDELITNQKRGNRQSK